MNVFHTNPDIWPPQLVNQTIFRWKYQQPRLAASAGLPGPGVRQGGRGHRGSLRHDGRQGRGHQEDLSGEWSRWQGRSPQLRRQILFQFLRTI